MRTHHRHFLLSPGETPDVLREIIVLLRDGWRVIESRPADQVSRPKAAGNPSTDGPYALVVMERMEAKGP